jgi:hypothetical protein
MGIEITPEIQELLDAQRKEDKDGFEVEVAGLKKNVADWSKEKDDAKKLAEDNAEIARLAKLDKDEASNDTKSLRLSMQEIIDGKDLIINGMNEKDKQTSKSQVASDFMKSLNVFGSDIALEQIERDVLARVDIRDGETVVLDAKGGLTGNTLDDLLKEFSASSRYAENIKGTQARGNGADGSKVTSGARKSFKEMSESEKIAFKRSDPDGFKRAINL